MDNAVLYLCMFAGTVGIVYAIVLALRQKKPEDHLICVRETKTVLGMTALAVAVGYGICVYKMMDATIGGEGTNSYWLCGISGLILLLMAAYTILMAFVKRTIVYDEHLEIISEMGKKRIIPWDKIVRVERAGMQKAARFTFADGSTYVLSGANRNYKKFMLLVRTRLDQRKGADLIRQVEDNMTGL